MVALTAGRTRLGRVRFRCPDRHARDHDIERAAFRASALGPDATAMARDDLLADVETEAHAGGVARGAIRGAVEQAEDRLELLLGDPDPLVGDGHPYTALIGTHVDRDGAAGGRVLDRIRQKVV